MQPFQAASGRALTLLQPNIDTDVIIRINRLNKVRMQPQGRSMLGRWAFESLRYAPDGSEQPGCILNDQRFRGAPILIAGPNFGCGSSREGAVWAMAGIGIRCVIAESFGDRVFRRAWPGFALLLGLDEIGETMQHVADIAAWQDADQVNRPWMWNL